MRIADRMEQYLPFLAAVETYDNGKPIRETNLADLPLAVDHFRYFASCVRAQEGSLGELDEDTVAYHYHEPLGVVGQIIPWNFPILMAAWKLAPALAAGNCVVIKPAEQTPLSLLVLAELIQDILPPGVLNIVNGFGLEAGKPLASNPRIAKIAFTGETTTGRLIMQYASENIIPVTLELGGKSPNIFFADVMREDDDFVDKALEGFAMFALNQGEVCTCPSRALVQKSIYERFMERAVKRVEKIRQGDPYEMTHADRRAGLERSVREDPFLHRHRQEGRREGARRRRRQQAVRASLRAASTSSRPCSRATTRCASSRRRSSGPVVSVTTFDTPEEALEIANDTLYGLGAGVWTRDINLAYRFGRGIKAGRVWTNCYHAYPAHAAFGGYKKSGIGRETHKMMLDHYQQTKNVLVSYSTKALGFF